MPKFIMFALLLIMTGAPLASSADEGEITGVWQSIGYGIWFDVREDAVDIYQTSAVSCLRLVNVSEIEYSSDAVLLKNVTIAGVGEFFGTFDYELSLKDDLLNFELGKVNPIQALRVDSLPAICDQLTEASSENSFETFWHFFNENYPFFEVRGMDWQSAYDTYRPMITDDTSEAELYTIIEEMISPLGDGHVSVNTMSGSFSPMALPEWLEDEEQIAEYMMIPFSNYLIDEPQMLANESIIYGYLSERVAYLGIFTFDASLHGEGETDALSEAMSIIAEDFPNLDSIVIDVRYNFGGEDTNGIYIAGYFIANPLLFSHKSVWFENEFVPIMDVYIEPTTDTPFTGDVYLLTSRMTISAAEIYSLAMSTMPNVTLIGEPTNGMLSDAWFAIMPNGWLVSLANEQYLTIDHLQYEGLGVPVDVELLITDETFAGGQDLILEEALSRAQQ